MRYSALLIGGFNMISLIHIIKMASHSQPCDTGTHVFMAIIIVLNTCTNVIDEPTNLIAPFVTISLSDFIKSAHAFY